MASELPDIMIQHIMRFLPTKEAARSSILSKQWLRAWSTRHFLDFDQDDFRNRREDEMLNFVDETLEKYSQNTTYIDRFKLHIHGVSSDKFLPFLEKWLPIVLQYDNLLALSFKIRWTFSSVAPQIFGSKSLQALFVSSDIYPRVHVSLVLTNSDIMCRNLKMLRLENLRMDDATFSNLVTCCPLIESFYLVNCWGQFKIKIANLRYLRDLDFYYNGVHDVDIDAPMLRYLNCWTRTRLNIGESGNLRRLSVFQSSLVDEQLQNILSKNPFLVYLNLSQCNMLTWINYSTSSLRWLQIHHCLRLVEATIDVPNLCQLWYYNLGKTRLHITSPRPISKGHLGIKCRHVEIDASWLHGLRGFLTNFQQSSVEIISFQDMQFNCEGFRAMPLPYDHQVESLTLDYDRPICIKHLDGLLSTCRPKVVTCRYRDTRFDNASMENFMKKLTSRKIPKCCVSDEIKCWRHYLRDVKLYHMVDNVWKPLQLNRSFPSRFFLFLISCRFFLFLIRFLSIFFKLSRAEKNPKVLVSLNLEWNSNE